MAWDEQQVLAVLAAVPCPVQVIRGSRGMQLEEAVATPRLAALKNPEVSVIDGGHHVHLDSPAEVARVVQRFVDAHA
jgi:pimeloyl-ACP methyl ester carboxylesterase